MKRVLVVDDDVHIRKLMKFALLSAGFEVRLAENGLEALHLAREERPDAIVLDVNMPVMDGRETFAHLDGPDRPPVLVISADKPAQVRRELGAEASLPKPFDPDQMIQKLSELTGDLVSV